MRLARLVRSTTLAFIAVFVASCGGGGSGPGTPDAGTPGGVAASKVFVGDSANAAIGSSVNSNPSAGTLVVDRVISGSSTQLSVSLSDFAMDAANDRLYVADLNRIFVFNGASTLSGNVAPSRTVTSVAGPASISGGIYLDAAGAGRLYAATNAPGTTQSVLVFDNASTAINAAATRSITFTIRNILDIAVDTVNNILYVYGADTNGFNEILSFNNASTLDGPRVPDRTIAFNDNGGTGPVGIFVDGANDRLWVPRNGGTIAVFDAASTVDGAVNGTAAPSRTIDLNPLTLGYSVAFVELGSNRLYTLDPSGVNIIANASTVNGTPTTITRAVAPGGSTFQAIWVKP